jgi:hypothetical protein
MIQRIDTFACVPSRQRELLFYWIKRLIYWNNNHLKYICGIGIFAQHSKWMIITWRHNYSNNNYRNLSLQHRHICSACLLFEDIKTTKALSASSYYECPPLASLTTLLWVWISGKWGFPVIRWTFGLFLLRERTNERLSRLFNRKSRRREEEGGFAQRQLIHWPMLFIWSVYLRRNVSVAL